ncbi:MAG: maleylpyruvate isomerase family mycothiol-dependent enzyme [Actinomycetota bacterium]
MEISRLITAIAHEGKLFAEAANGAGLDADVSCCPDWDVRELVRHLSSVHLWAAAHVANRATEWRDHGPTELAEYWPDLAVFWPDDDELVDWYLETNANLVRELTDAPPDLECLTFLPAPTPQAMWARRQAHETAIHRFDADSSANDSAEYAPDFAVDGIDEILMLFAPRWGIPTDDAKTMVVRTTDTNNSWHVTMGPEKISTDRGDGPADLTLTGSASDLYLAVWNRGNPPITATGDAELVATWHENYKFVWN